MTDIQMRRRDGPSRTRGLRRQAGREQGPEDLLASAREENAPIQFEPA